MPGSNKDDASFERITPLVPEAARSRNKTTESRASAGQPFQEPQTQGRHWPLAFALLILALGLVLFWLPEHLSTPEPARTQTPTEPPATGKEAVAPETESLAAPLEGISFDTEAVLEKRRQAQALREEARAQKDALMERGLSQWAETQAETLSRQFAEADTHFSNRDFETARRGYQQALDKIEQLQERANRLLAESISQGQAALEAGDDEAAMGVFELALTIDPGNAEAKQGKRRAATLEAVLARLNAAESAEARGELEQARVELQAAVKLDPQHRRAQAGLARVKEALKERAFAGAMSRGLSALQNGDFMSAQSAFQEALKLEAQSPAGRDGLEQARLGIQKHRLETLRRQALEAEQKEQWAEARALYTEALDIDASLGFAQQGRQRTDRRAQLDARLQSHIDQPVRLTARSVRNHAKQALSQAESIDPPGSRLQRQMAQLTQLLDEASMPVPVTLYSDGETQVIVYPMNQIGELGTFTSKSLSLPPGQYTAIGRRAGYRDVRIAFKVTTDGVSEPPVIKTEERI